MKVQTAISNKFAKPPVKLRQVVNNLKRSRIIIKTGCQSIDDALIGHGIESGCVTQISGPESSGKTQLCQNLVVEAIKLGKQVLYIDTQSAFSVTRLMHLLANKGLGRDLINSVQVARIYSVCDLLDLLILVLEENEYSLLVIDSLPALFNPCFVEFQNQDRMFISFEYLIELTRILAAIRLKHPGLSIVVTNYTDEWYRRFMGLTNSLYINLSISLINPPEIIYSAQLKYINQRPSQYKSCLFVITDSGLLPDFPERLSSSHSTQESSQAQNSLSQSSALSQQSILSISQGSRDDESISSQLIIADHNGAAEDTVDNFNENLYLERSIQQMSTDDDDLQLLDQLGSNRQMRIEVEECLMLS